MTSERIEWVEIIEPRTKEHMYANLTTGECVWDAPEGVRIKRADSSQWWELFDSNTQRFYYYNAASQTTVWHRPTNCDIIPLAKLQTLKQNTEPSEKKDGCTQTSHSRIRSHHNKNKDSGHYRHHSSGHARIQSAGSSEAKCSSELLSSPHGRHGYRYPSADSCMIGKIESSKQCRHSQASALPHGSGTKHKESGKSSDSSLSSAHGYRRLQEGGSLRIGSSHHRSRHISDNRYQQQHLQQHCPHPKLSYSISNSSDLGALSPTHSANTPILKKKLSSETSLHHHGGKREGGSGLVLKHQSFDCPSGNAAITSLTRSGSFMSSPTSHTSHIAAAQFNNRKTTITNDGNGGSGGNGGGSDDSMHEKYFKSVENTPVTRRRHTNTSSRCSGVVSSVKKNSSDSSPQSPISPEDHNNKSSRPTILNSISGLESPSLCYNRVSSRNSDPDFLNLDLTVKPERYLDKMKLDKRSPSSFGGGGSTTRTSPLGNLSSVGYHEQQQQQQQQQYRMNNVFVKSPSSNRGGVGSSGSGGGGIGENRHSPATSSHYPNDYNLLGPQYLNKSNVDRHNKDVQKNIEKSSSKRERRRHHAPSSDIEYDNGNISPLYSNWDQEMQEHLLPLQHYIIEQAKLSGCYGFGDPLDSDSFHSDSQSEHSFSGHEPDNEDSDHSDGHGDYLTHNYGLMDDYVSNIGDRISYYNYNIGFDQGDKEDISENVEAVLESERDNTQIYSPVRSYPRSFLSQSKSIASQQQQQQQHQHQHHQGTRIPSPNRQIHHQVPDQSELSSSPKQKLQSNKDQDVLESSTNQKRKPPPIFPIFRPPPAGPVSGGNESGSSGIPELAIMKECDIEKFAQDNLNLHSKGIFRKKSSIRDMLSWTSNAISRPMLALARDKAGKKMATELFKLVQIYMGDRKARAGMSLNSVAIDIIVTALGQQQLRDELYVQLCRQTTENPKRESLIRGWELLAICLSFVPPSPTFQPALLNYVNRHRDPTFATSFPEVGKWPIHVQISHYATVCCRRLDRIGSSGRKQAKKPTEDEIEQARNQILRDSMFGNTLNEVMELQKDKYPDRKLPWIQVTLSEQVLLLNGKQTEGIFRVSADVDEVNSLKAKLDRWEIPEHKNTMDAHAPASLLKLWYRELYDPLIPDELYDECVQTEDPAEANKIIAKLPELNKLVLTYLVRFLQQFAQPDVVSCTKMDSSNLAMVFAPNCLRCTSQDPKIILENARKEMAFMRTLIQHMDTSNVENLV